MTITWGFLAIRRAVQNNWGEVGAASRLLSKLPACLSRGATAEENARLEDTHLQVG